MSVFADSSSRQWQPESTRQWQPESTMDVCRCQPKETVGLHSSRCQIPYMRLDSSKHKPCSLRCCTPRAAAPSSCTPLWNGHTFMYQAIMVTHNSSCQPTRLKLCGHQQLRHRSTRHPWLLCSASLRDAQTLNKPHLAPSITTQVQSSTGIQHAVSAAVALIP